RGFFVCLRLLADGQGETCGPHGRGEQCGQQQGSASGPSHWEPSLQLMARRVAGQAFTTAESCCRSGGSRELLILRRRGRRRQKLAASAAPTRAGAWAERIRPR